MNAICLIVAGVVRATLSTSDLTLTWEHSVERTTWEERYRVEGDNLVMTEARVQGSGAGMEPAKDAGLEDGWWRWTPQPKAIPELRLTFSEYTRDYRLCWRHRCWELAALLGRRPADGELVEVHGCASGTPPYQTQRY